jgi:hypothetical protein
VKVSQSGSPTLFANAILTAFIWESSAILGAVNQRNLFANWARQPMSLSTISKALKGLEKELIVAREGAATRLLQSEKLLDKLVENYTAPKVEEVVNWKLPTSLGEEERKEVLVEAFSSKIPAVMTGASSVSRSAVMQAGEILSIDCPEMKAWFGLRPSEPIWSSWQATNGTRKRCSR